MKRVGGVFHRQGCPPKRAQRIGSYSPFRVAFGNEYKESRRHRAFVPENERKGSKRELATSGQTAGRATGETLSAILGRNCLPDLA